MMFRKVLNGIFSSRVFYILFSLLIAFAVWLFVEYNENTTVPLEIPNVHIRFKNTELLADRGFLISSVSPQTITLTYDLPRATAAVISRETFEVEVDLQEIRQIGITQLKFNVIYPNGFNDSSYIREIKSVELISLFVDRLTTVPVPVRVDFSVETPSEDLLVDPVIFEPQSISVSGPEEVLSKIGHARVAVHREMLSSTLSEYMSFVLVDEDGEVLDEDLLESVSFSHEEIHVTVPIRQMKTVPLVIDLVHGAGSSNRNTQYNITPSSVVVSGDPEALRDFDRIVLPPIDMTSFDQMVTTVVQTFSIPPQIRNESGETEAQIRIEIMGLGIRDYPTSNISWVNAPAGYRVELTSRSVDVMVRGRREFLDQITEMNIRVVADLRDKQTGGSYRVNATVYIDGIDGDVGAIGTVIVSLRIISEES